MITKWAVGRSRKSLKNWVKKLFFTKTIDFRIKATISFNVQLITGQLRFAFTARTFFSVCSFLSGSFHAQVASITNINGLRLQCIGLYTFSDFFPACVVWWHQRCRLGTDRLGCKQIADTALEHFEFEFQKGRTFRCSIISRVLSSKVHAVRWAALWFGSLISNAPVRQLAVAAHGWPVCKSSELFFRFKWPFIHLSVCSTFFLFLQLNYLIFKF